MEESPADMKHSLSDPEDSHLSKKSRSENSSECADTNTSSEDISSSNSKATEFDVGITEYISSVTGFTATVKERFSDFIVNEINKQGNVVRLTNLDEPENPEANLEYSEAIDEETMEKLESLSNDKEVEEVLIEVTDKDKDARKNIHIAIRHLFSGLESSTADRDSKKYIIVKKMVKRKGQRFQPSVGGMNYLHFVLYKENRDTMDAINVISSFLHLKPKVFSYAGSKDKRAMTSQMVSAYRIQPKKLLSINKQLNQMRVGNLEYKKEQLKLGDLSGNLFVLILRQLVGEPSIIEQAIDSLSTKGFVNYFGLQRFGTQAIPTHWIGRAILKTEWEKAIDLILALKDTDPSDLTKAKKIWHETKNAEKAFSFLKCKWCTEGKILQGFIDSKGLSCQTALLALPRNMRLLYIHSYQSYIWNKVVSKRMRQHGTKVLKGDLVPNTSEVVETTDDDANGEWASRKALLRSMVRFVTEEEVDTVDITDVVMPLPGHSVVFPDNETKDWYQQFLKEDDMSLDNLDSKSKTYSLSGSYRKFVVVPKDIKWEIIPYDDNTVPLALSDLDVLNEKALEISQNGSLKSLKIQFSLPASSYATMALREIMKSGHGHVNTELVQ